MGIVKQWLLEQAQAEAAANVGKCTRCGCELDDDELECDRDECFECYCEAQG